MSINSIKKVVIASVLFFNFLIGAVSAMEETSSTEQDTQKAETKELKTTILEDILILLGLELPKDGNDPAPNVRKCDDLDCTGQVKH